jgi:outer membrane autotransporter protein
VSLYAAIPAMTLLYGRAILDTLHERVGEEEDVRGRANPLTSGPSGAWGRVIGMHGYRKGESIFGNGPTYGYDFLGFQAGQDLYRHARPDGIRDHAGLYFAFGEARGSVQHFDGSGGNANFRGFSAGGYWTRFGPSGWYVDAVLQGTWYDVASNANRGLPSLNTNGVGFAGSLQGGYPFRLGNGFFVEPQAQLIYQRIDLADTGDVANTTVRFSNVDSLAGRIGARFGRTWALDSGPKAPSITAWLNPNFWHEFRGEPRTEFSSDIGFIPFRAQLGGSWLELNAGASARIGDGLSLFGNVGYQTRLDSVAYSYTGKFGLRKVW